MSCGVRTCVNYGSKTKLPGCHRVPWKDPARSKWLALIGRQDIDANTLCYVCSLHFSAADYATPSAVVQSSVGVSFRRVLKRDATPSRNLPGQQCKRERTDADGENETKSTVAPDPDGTTDSDALATGLHSRPKYDWSRFRRLLGIDDRPARTVGTHACAVTSAKSTQTPDEWRGQYRDNASTFKCFPCGREFTTYDYLQRHFKARHYRRGGPHRCQYCDYSSVTVQRIRLHEQRHTGERPFIHPSCSMACTESVDGEKAHKCHACGQSYHDRIDLARHQEQENHQTESPTPPKVEKRFGCPHCAKTFRTRSNLAKHALLHSGERPFCCTYCGATFIQNSCLQRHVVCVHTKAFRHRCDSCGKGFYNRRELGRHVQNTCGHVA